MSSGRNSAGKRRKWSWKSTESTKPRRAQTKAVVSHWNGGSSKKRININLENEVKTVGREFSHV